MTTYVRVSGGPAAPPSFLDTWCEQVRMFPDEVAVEETGRKFSYSQMDRWGADIASQLNGRGISSDPDPVLAARVKADLARSRTPRQIAGRLRLEATDASVEIMTKSPDAQGRTVSHEAIYRWIYALRKGELAKSGILLQSKRTHRKSRKPFPTGTAKVRLFSSGARMNARDARRPGLWDYMGALWNVYV